ncbi:hypothetical protein N2152v2_001894 [Parachlorella kessleri]
MAEAPLKVTADQLGIHQGEQHDGRLEFDLGNLAAFDPSPLDAATFAGGDIPAACHRLATSIQQALTAQLFGLPSEAAPVGRVAQLPAPSTVLPREKPLPKPRPPTKWELFAQRKGIVKRKRSKLEFDENSQEWRRRFGYKKAGDDDDVPVIEAGPNDEAGDDPFTKQRQERKDRVKKQAKQQLSNLKAATKAGATLPPTLRLAAALPEHGKGRPVKRKEYQGELKATTRQVGVSTASMGKFDRMVEGERAEDRKAPAAKRRKFLPVVDKAGGERQAQSKLVDHILRSNADDIVDIGRAIGKLEASARQERHTLKMKGANKKGRITKGPGGGGGGRGKAGAAGGGKGAKGGSGGKAGRCSGGVKGGKGKR